LFVVEGSSAQPLRGVASPVELYQVIRPTGVRGRLAAARALTPFVGREEELQLLLSRWEHAREGDGQVALVVGEAGIGKSRLVAEFRHRIQQTPHIWMESAGEQFFENTPFHAYTEMLSQWLELQGGLTADERLGQVERAMASAKALEYLQRAGGQALQRSSHARAIELFTSALELLQTLPERPERLQQELALQLGLGPALIAIKGRAAAEVGQTFARARELCNQMGETPQLLPTLAGLCAFYDVRGELDTARELAEQLLSIARSRQDAALLPHAHHAVGNTLFFQGGFAAAQTHLERAVSLYDPAGHPSHAFPYFGSDVAVQSLCLEAVNLWNFCYPDQALERVERGLALARKLSHPFSVTVAFAFSAVVHSQRGEGEAALRFADLSVRLATEQGFQEMLAFAIIFRAWALVVGGQAEEGIGQLREGIASVRASGAQQGRAGLLSCIAAGYGLLGRAEEGLTAVAEATAVVNGTGERAYEAELYRLEGELLLQRDAAGASSKVEDESEMRFRQAIEIARRQEARSWELRATMSLARLLDKQGRRDEARTMLAEIYNWFTEGFDTRDLKDANALLDELVS